MQICRAINRGRHGVKRTRNKSVELIDRAHRGACFQSFSNYQGSQLPLQQDLSQSQLVTPRRLQGGGFLSRLKAGPVRGSRSQVTLKLLSGSGDFWFLVYLIHISSGTLSLVATQYPRATSAAPNNAYATAQTHFTTCASCALSDIALRALLISLAAPIQAYVYGPD